MLFSHVSFKHYWKTVLKFIQSVHKNGTLSNTKTHMRDATECINSVGYALFVVIKAIFSNPNGSEMIINYIQTSLAINIKK